MILIVEDNEINCKLMSKIFDKTGLHYDLARDGQEALEAYKTKKYNLILMDCQMPTLDGYEATIEIRKLENKNDHIPIIAMTANVMQSDKEKCLEAGMDNYISKPIEIKELMNILNKYINKI